MAVLSRELDFSSTMVEMDSNEETRWRALKGLVGASRKGPGACRCSAANLRFARSRSHVTYQRCCTNRHWHCQKSQRNGRHRHVSEVEEVGHGWESKPPDSIVRESLDLDLCNAELFIPGLSMKLPLAWSHSSCEGWARWTGSQLSASTIAEIPAPSQSDSHQAFDPARLRLESMLFLWKSSIRWRPFDDWEPLNRWACTQDGSFFSCGLEGQFNRLCQLSQHVGSGAWLDGLPLERGKKSLLE